jgi:hypothetical protein
MTRNKITSNNGLNIPLMSLDARLINVEIAWKIQDRRYNKFYKRIESDLQSLLQNIFDISISLAQPADKGSHLFQYLECQKRHFTYRLKKMQDNLHFTIWFEDHGALWDCGKPTYNQVDNAQYSRLSREIIDFRRSLNDDIVKLNSEVFNCGLKDAYEQLLQALYKHYYSTNRAIGNQSNVKSEEQSTQPSDQQNLVPLIDAAIQESMSILSTLGSGLIPLFSSYHAILEYFSCQKGGTGLQFDYTFGVSDHIYATRAVNFIPHAPIEDLPRIGKIYEHNGKRYLGITDEQCCETAEDEQKRLGLPLTFISDELALFFKMGLPRKYRIALYVLDYMQPILLEQTRKILHKSRGGWLNRTDIKKKIDELTAQSKSGSVKFSVHNLSFEKIIKVLTEIRIIDKEIDETVHITPTLLDVWSVREFHEIAQKICENHLNLKRRKTIGNLNKRDCPDNS